jgi:acetyl esterase
MNGSRPTLSADGSAFVAAVDLREGEWKRPIAEQRREVREAVLAYSGEAEPVASVEDLEVGGVPARLYRPRGSTGALVWFHGGGWAVGGIDEHDPFARAIANRADCAVLSVDYRLAPEHPYPAAIEDCWAATEWACGRFDRVAVGGDSAGGNLAAAVALRARDAAVELALQLLVYPGLDPELGTPFAKEFVDHYTEFAGMKRFGEDAWLGVRYAWRLYVPDPERRTEPDVSPLRAPSLAGLAPATMILAEHDIVRGEGEEYAARLEQEGVAVELRSYEGQVHGFYGLLGATKDADDALAYSAQALRRAFAADLDP